MHPKTATVFTAALLGAASNAAAQQPSFDGARVEAVGGYDQTDSAPGRGAQDGALYGGRLGYDRDLGGFVLGAEGDLLLSDAASTEGAFSSQAQSYWSLALRAGLPLGDRILAFARGGIGSARIDTSLGRANGTGFAVGGGLEARLGARPFLRGEYRYSDYGDRLRGQQFTAGLGWRF